ncbi:hypothetical protein [Maribacter sp. 2308TA10-17]|uniref:hypothetical protein n=1 Tax=Maribacter sp. 2308TA10-17 TaxID=3386276 RepID=UPI0039BCB0FB
MENMYTGKSSKNPNMPLIYGALMGIGLIAFGIYLYFDLAAWENSNEEMRLNSLLWLLYDLGGKLTVAGFFGVIGAVVIGGGFKKTQELRKLKNGGDKS